MRFDRGADPIDPIAPSPHRLTAGAASLLVPTHAKANRSRASRIVRCECDTDVPSTNIVLVRKFAFLSQVLVTLISS